MTSTFFLPCLFYFLWWVISGCVFACQCEPSLEEVMAGQNESLAERDQQFQSSETPAKTKKEDAFCFLLSRWKIKKKTERWMLRNLELLKERKAENSISDSWSFKVTSFWPVHVKDVVQTLKPDLLLHHIALQLPFSFWFCPIWY